MHAIEFVSIEAFDICGAQTYLDNKDICVNIHIFMLTCDHTNLPYFSVVLSTSIQISQPKCISHFIPNVENSRFLPNQRTVLLLCVHSWAILRNVSGEILSSIVYFKFWTEAQLPEAKLLIDCLVTQANWRLILV